MHPYCGMGLINETNRLYIKTYIMVKLFKNKKRAFTSHDIELESTCCKRGFKTKKTYKLKTNNPILEKKLLS